VVVRNLVYRARTDHPVPGADEAASRRVGLRVDDARKRGPVRAEDLAERLFGRNGVVDKTHENEMVVRNPVVDARQLLSKVPDLRRGCREVSVAAERAGTCIWKRKPIEQRPGKRI